MLHFVEVLFGYSPIHLSDRLRRIFDRWIAPIKRVGAPGRADLSCAAQMENERLSCSKDRLTGLDELGPAKTQAGPVFIEGDRAHCVESCALERPPSGVAIEIAFEFL